MWLRLLAWFLVAVACGYALGCWHNYRGASIYLGANRQVGDGLHVQSERLEATADPATAVQLGVTLHFDYAGKDAPPRPGSKDNADSEQAVDDDRVPGTGDASE